MKILFFVFLIILCFSCNFNESTSQAESIFINFDYDTKDYFNILDVFPKYVKINLITKDLYYLADYIKYAYNDCYLAILQSPNNPKLMDLRIFDISTGEQICQGAIVTTLHPEEYHRAIDNATITLKKAKVDMLDFFTGAGIPGEGIV